MVNGIGTRLWSRFVVVVVGVSLAVAGLVVFEQPAARADDASAKVVSRPDEVSARIAARAQGSRVEVTGDRTSDTSTYANPDGTLTLDAYAGPVRVRDAKGEWEDIDTDLDVSGGVVAPKVAAADVELSNGGSEAPLGQVAIAKQDLSDAAASVKSAAASADDDETAGSTVPDSAPSAGFDWPTSLPTPTLDGNTATYADVSPGVDVRVQVTPRGFETFVVVKTADAAGQIAKDGLSLPLDMSGLKASETKTDSLAFTDAAGQTVGVAGQAEVWDSSEVAHDVPGHDQGLDASLTQNGSTLKVALPQSYLDTAGLTYPLTIDPASTLSASADTFVENTAPTATHGSVTEMRTGAGETTDTKSRAFMYFPTGAATGTQVVSASLHLWQWSAVTCTATRMDVRRLTSNFSETTATWNNQPSYDASTSWGSVTEAHGYDSSCPAAWLGGSSGIDVTSLVNGWANNTFPNDGLALTANEAQAHSWKRVTSDDDAKTQYHPYISVTYYHHPSTPTALSVSPGVGAQPATSSYTTPDDYVSSTTPTLAANVADAADAGTKVQGKFVVYNSSGTAVWTGYGSSSTTSGKSTVTVPSGVLANGGAYEVSAWTHTTVTVNGSSTAVDSPSASSLYVAVDTTAPSSPVINSSAGYSNGSLSATASTSNTFTFASTSSDTASFSYSEDGGQWRSIAASGLSATTDTSWEPTTGTHTIVAKTVDQAGNTSGSTTFTIVLNGAGLTSPTSGQSTARFFPVAASAPLGATGVTLAWAKDATSPSWTTIANSAVTKASGGSWSGAPTSTDTSTAYAKLVWDTSATSGVPTGTVLDLKVCFTGYSGGDKCTLVQVSVLDHATSGNSATTSAGPATVSLSTGELSLSATDATSPDGSVSVDRSYGSSDAATSSVFGPGWSTSLATDGEGAQDATVVTTVDSSGVFSSASLQYADGSQDTWAYDHTSSGARVYTGSGDTAADDSTLTLAADGTTLTLTDSDNVQTVWTRASATASTWSWKSVTSPDEPNTPGTTSGSFAAASGTYGYLTDDGYHTTVTPSLANTAGTNVVSCAASTFDPTNPSAGFGLARGCEALTVVTTASSVTAPTGTNLGAYPGRVREVLASTWNPSTSAMTTTVVAAYTYDAAGYLRQEWDPRADLSGNHLITGYGYDESGTGMLTSITPPGQAAWTYTYDTSSSSATYQHLLKVSRADPVLAKTATETIVYNVPLSKSLSGSGSANLPDLSSTTSWGQSDIPYTGTAVFSADHQPASTTATGVADGDWPYAQVTYLDILGRTVNTASYGAGRWAWDATQYDGAGNTSWSITAGNLAQAISPTDATPDSVAAVSDEAARAQMLATINTYDSSDPSELVDVKGPVHPVETDQADGSAQLNGATDGRQHTVTVYDQGAPASVTANGQTYNMPFDLPTTTTTSAYVFDASKGTWSDQGSRVVTDSYDPIVSGDGNGWVLRQATKVTTAVIGSSTVSRVTRYDTLGNAIQARQPKSTGSDALATNTVYYTADASASVVACRSHPEWAGQVCQTGPAAQPVSGSTLPVTTTSYNSLLQPVSVVAASGGSASNETRTTAYSYDGSGRVLTKSVTVANDSNGHDQALSAQSFGYDPATGLATTTSAGSSTVSTGYDTWGRVTSYTDASGVTSTTSYDIDSRPASHFDGKDTYTYSYDGSDANGAVEHRGLVTGLSVSSGSSYNKTFTAAYDNDGDIACEVLPNGTTAAWTDDSVGETTELSYTPHGATDTLVNDTRYYDVFGQALANSELTGINLYGYDGAGRLDQSAYMGYAGSWTRSYTLDADSNRTKSVLVGADASDDSVNATVTGTFDDADRDTNAGYVYDGLGRTTTLPSADTSSGTGNVSLGYYANDMAAYQAQTNSAGQSVSQAYTLDPEQDRTGSWTVTTAGTAGATHVNHYDDSTDSPSWTDEGANSWTRDVSDISGSLAMVVTGTGSTPSGEELQLANIHGDVIATMADTTNATIIDCAQGYDEFGNTLTGTTSRYGWLGTHQRSTDTIGGLTVMGVRLYNPVTGRFATTDPVFGGSDGPYLYPTDPINSLDLNGQWWRWVRRAWHSNRKLRRWVWRNKWAIGSVAACAFGGEIACAAGSVAYAIADGYHTYRHVRRHRWRAVAETAGWDLGWSALGMGADRGVGRLYAEEEHPVTRWAMRAEVTSGQYIANTILRHNFLRY